MAGRKRVAITGDPGTAWTNSTATCQWQLIVNWRNSCGRCVQYDRQIAVAWGIPFHYGCVCRSLPVWPGETAQPFVDFREKIQTLDPIEQSRVMGRSNLTLVQAGVLTWDDVITRSRILDLHESVAKHRLTVDQMVKAGVDPYQAQKAWNTVHTPANEAAAKKAAELFAKLQAAGVAPAEVQKQVTGQLAGRFFGSGASGPFAVRPPQPPPAAAAAAAPPPAPPVAPAAVRKAALQPTASPPAPLKPKRTRTEYTRFGSASEMNAWGKKQSGAQLDALSPTERRAITSYTAGEHRKVNPYLRGRRSGASKATVELAKTLKTALNKCKSTDAFIAYRGVKEARKAGINLAKIRPGDTIQDSAVVSTSLSKARAVEFAATGTNPVVLEIQMPSGTRGAYLNARELSAFEAEVEWLLPPGSGKFRVLGTRTEGGRTIIEVRLIK